MAVRAPHDGCTPALVLNVEYPLTLAAVLSANSRDKSKASGALGSAGQSTLSLSQLLGAGEDQRAVPLLTPVGRLRVARGVARALLFLHCSASPAVVHRRVEPASVLCDAADPSRVRLTALEAAQPVGGEPVPWSVCRLSFVLLLSFYNDLLMCRRHRCQDGLRLNYCHVYLTMLALMCFLLECWYDIITEQFYINYFIYLFYLFIQISQVVAIVEWTRTVC